MAKRKDVAVPRLAKIKWANVTVAVPRLSKAGPVTEKKPDNTGILPALVPGAADDKKR